MCNLDYKILAKVLARRIQLIIASLAGFHQTCGIRGRNIQDNIHIARSVLECVSDEAGQVALLQTDLAKALYRVNHPFLFAVLESAGLREALYKGISLCYQRCTTGLIVNHELSHVVVQLLDPLYGKVARYYHFYFLFVPRGALC